MTAYACNTPSPNSPVRRKGEDIVCAPRERGIKRREDRVELTSGVSALPPGGTQSSYVGKG